MNTPRFLPCPFCGEVEIRLKDASTSARVTCIRCGATILALISQKGLTLVEEVTARWNDRHGERLVRAELETTGKMLDGTLAALQKAKQR